MKIIEHPGSFEVQAADGRSLKTFTFDDNPGRRAISGVVKRKAALQAAKAFAGKGHTFEPAARKG
jgi:hypothetical protein